MGQLNTRILDGGLDAWKYIGERLAEGTGRKVEKGDVVLQEPTGRALLWKDVDAIVAKDSVLQFVDTRSVDEYTGKEQNKKAKRAGHIPNAVFFAWTDALEIREGAPRLKSPEVTVEALKALGIDAHKNTVLYCQSGTRSAAVYYALLQSGAFGNHVWNYDGSWAEYSRSDLPIETSL